MMSATKSYRQLALDKLDGRHLQLRVAKVNKHHAARRVLLLGQVLLVDAVCECHCV